jgi:hypothetical protein
VKAPQPLEVVSVLTRLGGDGYIPAEELLLALARDRCAASRGLRRAINRGYLLERRAPNGRLHVAVASDGWRLIEQGSADPDS